MPQSEEKRKPRLAKRPKNKSLELLRAVTRSMAGAIPGLSDETESTIEDTLARPVSGFMSQYMGVDPDTGEVKNPVIENMKRAWNSDERRKQGLPRQKRVMPGIVSDTMSIPNMFGNGPDWSQEAQETADATHQGVNYDMGMKAPEGFRQHALESTGMMAGQIPIAGQAKKASEATKGALGLMKNYGKKLLASPAEFFSPTVDPKMSNYVLGGTAGGVLGAMGDEVPEEELLPPRAVSRAKGGKVGALTQFLKSISINPDANVKQKGHMIGDPVEEVLYATNEGQRKGVLSSDEAVQIRALMEAGDDEALADALLDLQKRLFSVEAKPMAPQPPRVVPNPNDPHVRLDRDLGPMKPEEVYDPAGEIRKRLNLPMGGHGTLTQAEFDAMIQKGKARGGLFRFHN